ncbi:MAG: hypothetical protein U1E76_19255 [Planctomycetota bacterium]
MRHGRFWPDLCAFTKQLLLSDPQSLESAAEVVKAHRYELEYLQKLITWRLSRCEQPATPWRTDNQFMWRYQLQGNEVPPEALEQVDRLFAERDHDRTRAICRLLTECFPSYADGHLYLGLIARQHGDLGAATASVERAVRAGRSAFPAHPAEKRSGGGRSTPPYLRALVELGSLLHHQGQDDKALAIADRLEHECADDLAAATLRGPVHMKAGDYDRAFKAAVHINQIWPEHSIVAALAAFELGLELSAFQWFLHAVLNQPRTVRIVLGLRVPKPKTGSEHDDHQAGVRMREDLEGYLQRQGRKAVRVFRRTLAAAPVAALVDEARHVVRRWSEPKNGQGWRHAFDRMSQMHSVEYAEEQAQSLRQHSPRLVRGAKQVP